MARFQRGTENSGSTSLLKQVYTMGKASSLLCLHICGLDPMSSTHGSRLVVTADRYLDCWYHYGVEEWALCMRPPMSSARAGPGQQPPVYPHDSPSCVGRYSRMSFPYIYSGRKFGVSIAVGGTAPMPTEPAARAPFGTKYLLLIQKLLPSRATLLCLIPYNSASKKVPILRKYPCIRNLRVPEFCTHTHIS